MDQGGSPKVATAPPKQSCVCVCVYVNGYAGSGAMQDSEEETQRNSPLFDKASEILPDSRIEYVSLKATEWSPRLLTFFG